ncbi:hypothetical protein [Glacieibacterium frigidum]|nr:hypothetical protein [Glacieibacterium frigidum]
MIVSGSKESKTLTYSRRSKAFGGQAELVSGLARRLTPATLS